MVITIGKDQKQDSQGFIITVNLRLRRYSLRGKQLRVDEGNCMCYSPGDSKFLLRVVGGGGDGANSCTTPRSPGLRQVNGKEVSIKALATPLKPLAT